LASKPLPSAILCGVLPDRTADFEFQKRGQLFIGPYNETLTVAAICVSNPDLSPARIDG
jgi:hypothetical protein